jgi:hypothetical protein
MKERKGGGKTFERKEVSGEEKRTDGLCVLRSCHIKVVVNCVAGMFITVFTTARHFTLFEMKGISSKPVTLFLQYCYCLYCKLL